MPINHITNVNNESSIDYNYILSNNYPNPFNAFTTIHYTVPHLSHVIINIFDILGREVKTLVNEVKSRGKYSLQFELNESSSGIYLIKMTSIISAKQIKLFC